MHWNLKLRNFLKFLGGKHFGLIHCVHDFAAVTKPNDLILLYHNRQLSRLSKCGYLYDARQLFDKMPERDEFTWNIMVSGYANSGSFTEARGVFDKTPCKSSITWNAMISGYCQHGFANEAFELFWRMMFDGFKPTEFTVGSLLRVCSQLGLVSWGEKVHSFTVKTQLELSSFVATGLVNMYAKGNCIVEAEHIFELFPGSKSHVLWTAMLTGYTYCENGVKAMACFRDMRVEGIESNEFSFTSILKACATERFVGFGQQVHGCLIRSGSGDHVYIQCALVDMYAKCGDLASARLLLMNTRVDNATAWNSMLVGCVREGFEEEALSYFKKMHAEGIKIDEFTYPTILKCFASHSDIHFAKSIHCLTIKTGYEDYNLVSNALVDVYGKQGNLSCSLEVFNKLAKKDIVSWTSLVTSYSHNGLHEEALKLFGDMRVAGMSADAYLLSSILGACADITTLDFGLQVHTIAIKERCVPSLPIHNSLIALYAKCGCIEEAVNVFNSMIERDLISWTSIIVGLAQNGLAQVSIKFFERMLERGIKPDSVIFVGVLFACSHSGLVEKGKYYFESMDKNHGIKPGPQHYACMIDLLGRSGNMREIREMMKQMPVEADASMWKAVLAACRVHGNLEMAETAANNLLELEPQDAVPYILLANMYSAAGRWQEAARVRILMKTKAITKEPGRSWIEVEGNVHAFISADRRHQRTVDIYAKVHEIMELIKRAGYRPVVDFALQDMDEEGKELGLAYHSEKLAVAFGLLVLPPGLPVRVFKNIRVCGDCHTAMKFISRVFNRHIVLRDSNRFHHFRDGTCSCNDFW